MLVRGFVIIFGSKGKTKVVGRGKFMCPRCQAVRLYQHKKVTEHFTLYFIPIVKIDDLGEYIECTECATRYHTSILEK
jgi:transcription elongation factor Elf1